MKKIWLIILFVTIVTACFPLVSSELEPVLHARPLSDQKQKVKVVKNIDQKNDQEDIQKCFCLLCKTDDDYFFPNCKETWKDNDTITKCRISGQWTKIDKDQLKSYDKISDGKGVCQCGSPAKGEKMEIRS